jgi:NAD(P)H dehydrogenase (quinone)
MPSNAAVILIVYASSTGNTKRMAEAIAAGAREIGQTEVLLRATDQVRVEEVRRCDALILGTPVRHGNADARLRRFIETDCERLTFSGKLADKIGAVFTVGGHMGRYGDGGELAQLALLRPMAAAGMTLVSGPPEAHDPTSAGPYWGPHARLRMHENGRETLQPEMTALARTHGRRVAQMAHALHGRTVTASSTLPRVWNRLAGVFR